MQMQCWENGPTAARIQRELSYECSSGSGRAMGNGTGCSSAKDVGWGAVFLKPEPVTGPVHLMNRFTDRNRSNRDWFGLNEPVLEKYIK